MRVRPSRLLVLTLSASAALAAAALAGGAPLPLIAMASAVWIGTLAMLGIADWLYSRHCWRRAPATLSRQLPPALAIGVHRDVTLVLDSTAAVAWQGWIHDHAAPALGAEGQPARITIAPTATTVLRYRVAPSLRGEFAIHPAELRLRSRIRLWELQFRLGTTQSIRVYPDFAQVARYAWLASNRRLQDIGVRSAPRRGSGTDFRQLADYLPGDPVRHIDWKASMRLARPIVRHFQEEPDQHVWLLIDCGRRMRADDRTATAGTSHFDQVLNAVMLLAYVALRDGDAVGTFTFGTPPQLRKAVAPRKGISALDGLMREIFDLQPGTTHSDYLGAARDFLARKPRRSLVVILTNFRDEDSSELSQAVELLRRRHLVLVASLRERVVREMMEQALHGADAALEVASAQLYAQTLQDAFARLAARNSLIVEAEPQRLGIDLVNRYHAAKRAGML